MKTRRKVQNNPTDASLKYPIRKANLYRRMAKALKISNIAKNLLNCEFKEHGARVVLLTDIIYIPYCDSKKAIFLHIHCYLT